MKSHLNYFNYFNYFPHVLFPSLAVCIKLKETFHNVTENMAEQINSIRVLKQEKNVILNKLPV